MGFNLGFKGLINVDEIRCAKCRSFSHVSQRINQK